MDKYPASPPKGLTYDELCEGVTYWADRIEGLTNWAVYHKNYNDETNNAQTDEAAAACDAWYKAATDAHDQEARHAAL